MIKDIIFQGDGEIFTVTGKVIEDNESTIIFEPLTEAVDYMPQHIPDGFILSSDFAVEFGEMACFTKIYTDVYLATFKIVADVENVHHDDIVEIAEFQASKAVTSFGREFGLSHILKGLRRND